MGCAYYATKFSGNKRRKFLKTDTFHYIPVEDTLRRVLQMPDILKEIKNFHGSNDMVLRDMCDGSVFHSHPQFSSDKQTIQIIAYFDEVELCNPLGSSSKKHKLGCVFFTIGNIRQQFRSWLKCIFVASVARVPVIRKHGMNLFLQPFVDSMEILAKDGLTVTIEGKSQHFKVGLLAVLADNLAAHALGGFKESMSFSRRICRSCMATTEQIQVHFLESEFELRTRLGHQHQLQDLAGPMFAEKSVEYGINRKSNLDNIPSFSVAENIPHDIMHDLLEGVIPYEMKLMLKELVAQKYLTIATLNERLRCFDFGYSELSDKPSEIDVKVIADHSLRQSASKMWLLAIYLPLLVGDLIPEDCKVWKLFILLLRICSITASWQIEPNTIAYLEILIQEHHIKFRQLYPCKTIIPKMHYMVHYPSQILRYGPLIYSWTMRHEAKLSVIKHASSHGNFKNITYTVAKWSLHALCYHLNSDSGHSFLSRHTEISSVCPEIDLTNESKELRDYVSNICVLTIRNPTSLKFGPLFLKKFVYVFLGSGEFYPNFGKLINLYTLAISETISRHVIQLKRCETLYYDSHFNAYVISVVSPPIFSILEVSSLPLYPVIHAHKSFHGSETYIVLKQHVM